MIGKTKFSQLHFIERQAVNWGGYSMVSEEMKMLKECVKEDYSYIHLLSGMDFPIKCQDYIHDFCDRSGRQFIYFLDTESAKDAARSRIRYYWPLQEWIGCGTSKFYIILKRLQRGLVCIQKALGINRIKDLDSSDIAKGSQWFSITGDFARYIVSQEDFVCKHFRNTSCSDEVFIQILSKWSKRMDLAGSCRYIIWKDRNDCHPNVLSPNDEDALLKTDKLFARKFDCDRYPETLNMIKRVIAESQKEFNKTAPGR